jgi:hypothetical protein
VPRNRQQEATAKERDQLLRDQAVSQAKLAELEGREAATAQERDQLLREQAASQAKLAELEGREAATTQERDRLVGERDQALALVQKLAHPPDARPGSLFGQALVGVGVVSLAIGLGFGVTAALSWNDARHAGCDKAGQCPSFEGLQSVNTASSRATWSNVLVPVGLGVGAVGLWITFRRSTEPPTAQHVSVQFDGNSISVRGNF